MTRLGAVLIVVLLLNAGLPLHAQTAPYLDAKRAVGMVDTGATIGTAFAVSPTLVVTACHVIRGAAAIQIHFWAADQRVAGRQVLCNERYDVAVIVTAVPEGTAFLQFAEGKPAQGDRIWVWGYPLGTRIATEPSLAQGIVSATGINEGTFALDVSGGPGNSGGPVLNEEGKVIGILLGTWNAGPQSTGFKHAVLSTTAAALLAGVGSTAVSSTDAAPVSTKLDMGIRPGDGIGPVRLGMTPAEVQAALGVPPSERYPNGWMMWEARHISVFFDNGKAFLIDTDDPSLVTAEGIRVGSTDTDLIKAYGAPACSSVRNFRGQAYLGWYYGGLFVFLNGSPRQVFGIRVLPSASANAVCR